MDTLADYETWKAKQQQSNVGAANVVLSTTDGKPDEVAGHINLANEFAKISGSPVPPLAMVQEFSSVFQAEIARQKNSTILSSSPRLTQWLRNPENAAVAKDDLSNLSWWETPFVAAKNAISRGVDRVPMAYNQLMANAATERYQDQQQSFGDILASETDVRDKNGNLIYKRVPDPIDLFKAGSRYATSRFSEFAAGPDAAKNTAAYYQQQVGLINKRIAEIPMSPAGARGREIWTEVKPSGDVWADFGSYMQAIAKDPKAFAAFAAETAAESLPSLAAATAVTIGTGNPIAGAVTLGATSAATEMGTAPADLFKEHGLDISKPEDALAAISNPELMKAAVDRGNVRGVIVGMMDGLSGGVAGKTLAESPVGNMVLQSLTQAVMGASGEAGGQYFSGQQMSLGDILMEGIAEFATAPIEVVGVGREKFLDAQAKAKSAEARKALFEQLSGQAQSSALRNRLPEKFRQFVAEATKDGPVENVFIPAKKFTEYFQSMNLDPFDLVDSLEGVTREDLQAALDGGQDLQIPTATYAAQIAGSEHDAFLIDNMRFDPNEKTFGEAAEFNAKVSDALEEAWQLAEDLRLRNEELRSFEQEIYDTMVSRLRLAGRSTDVATTEAMLYPAFYRVMALRSGLTTEEFMQQYPLPQIKGSIPEGMQFRNVDALTRTLAEARAARTLSDKRQTLLEFISDYGGINDAGGELAARDATVVNRGKGKKSLRLARKGFVAGQSSMLGSGDGKRFGADDVALAAIERGYMADNPAVQEYLRAVEEGRQTPDITAALWDAIDAELSGSAQYSAHDAIDPAIERARDLSGIEEHLAEVGVSLDDDDATIRKALEKAGASSFNQFAGISAKTVELEALSKAVLMRAAGATRDEIYDETGFFVGPDGQWRFEISDADATIKQNALTKTKSGWRFDGTLGELLDHSKLFDAYTIFKGIPVKFKINPNAEAGGLWDGNSIEVQGKTLVHARSILLHEIAHVIQDQEGFAHGGNLEMGELYEGVTVEEIKREISQYVAEWEAIAKKLDGSPSAEERVKLEARIDQLEPKIRAAHADLIYAAKYEYYRRIAGEAEARNIQTRDRMQRADDMRQRYAAEALGKPPEKGTIPPPWNTADVPDNKVIVVRSTQHGGAFKALQVTPDQARRIDMSVELPSDPLFSEAVANTAGASITDDGLLIDLVRYQKPEQIGATSVRTGVFYLPVGSKNAKYYRGKGSVGGAYGGPVETRGETILKRPLFVKGATGGKAPEAAWNALKGKGAMKELDRAVMAVVTSKHMLREPGLFEENVSNFLEEHGADPTLAYEIIANSKQGNQLRYALQENVIAHAVREAGYDSVVGYSKGKAGASVSEVFDVREIDYPTPGETATLHPKFEGRSYNQGARGSIQFPSAGVSSGESIIRLFETANLSTVVHESGHFFLTVLEDLAARGEPHAAAEIKAVREWWRENADAVAKDATRSTDGVTVTVEDVTAWLDNGTTGDAVKDRALVVGGQEQFARGFEAYLMEGRAPNEELRSAFEKFRAWLVSIYQRLAGLNVKPSDQIRGVFDRMIATDEEIAKAQGNIGGSTPVFATAEQLGLTAAEYANLMKLRQQAEDSAKARLLREIMEPIKRQKEEWFKKEREKVKAQVTKEVNAYPYFRAIEWMGNKRWLGDGQDQDLPDMRLSKEILVARYGSGVLKTLPRGKQTIYTVDGGIDPDEAAGWFGFDSGDEMIQAMERAPKRTEAIEAETDRIMRDRHGDVLNDGSLEAEAVDAVHVDKRGQWIAAELKAVSEVAEREPALTAKEARASARLTIARMRVRDATASGRFLAAERAAAEEAERLAAQLARNSIWLKNANRRIEAKARAVAKGEASPDALAKAIEDRNAKLESRDQTVQRTERRFGADGGQFIATTPVETHTAGYNELVANLIDAKRRQLINHALYTESRKVAEEVEKAENYVKRLNSKSTRERIAGAGRRENATIDYLGAIDEILERYDFRKISGAAEQRRGTLNAFIEAMKAAGRENEISIPESVLSDAARKPYKTLPVEQLRGVIDSLKNLEHVATRWDKLIDAQNERALDEVVTEIAEAFEANVKKRPPGRVKTKAEAIRHGARQFLDLVLNATTLLREIDGFKDAGTAYRNIKAPIDAAMSRLIVRKEKAATALEGLYSVYSKAERREMAVRRHMPEIGFALSKWERIAVALNTGNEGNMQRLTDPKVRGSFTEAQVAAILATLDERDADFVQSVWDYVGSFWNDIAARERRTTGVEPKRVEGSPVTIGGKTLAGGYYPIKYDPRLSSLARDDQTQEIAQSLQAGRFGKAQTRNGHLKERAQSSGRDVELDMSVLHRHVNQVIYDLELSEPVANSWRILQDGRIRDAFTETGKQADFDALELWLKDVAEGELRSGDFVGRAARSLKSNFTAAKLAFNLVTVASQISGLSQTMVVLGKRDFVRGLQASLRPGAIADITAKSAFMSTRATTFNKDINDFYNDPKMGPVASRWGDIKSEWIGPLSFWLMTKVQWYTVDIPSWLAGYQQGLRRFGNDEAKAIAHADDVVKRAQASGLFSDRSAIERGSVTRTARQNDVVRLFTALGSYMFAKFNVAYERTGKASRTLQQEGVSARSAVEVMSWTVDMVFLFTLEAVIMAAIRGQLPGGDDGEDDKKDGWAKFLAKQTGLSVMGTIPFVRDGASALQGFDGGGAYGGIIGDAGKGAIGLFNVLTAPLSEDGLAGIKPKDIKGIINATGLATGLPATQVNRGVDALMRSNEGEDVSPLEYILGRRGK
ncbi:LPD23 domain-containing protein [Hyphomicrobium sp. 99]|uniref:LPD23 domain-containing protein n=1 Tax=Hyphomicrobium sp. 99 TaxID=1163419 RepID=UPI0005F80BEA|nr:LPD23 domain-containing protein [Hyphomicrobium sp. 99]